MNDQPKSLTAILATLNTGEENDIAFITAATMNLYLESRRRLFGKVLLGREDVKVILSIIDSLLTDRQAETDNRATRTRTLTEGEEKELLQGLERRI